jgi:hypothetical protein
MQKLWEEEDRLGNNKIGRFAWICWNGKTDLGDVGYVGPLIHLVMDEASIYFLNR